MTRRHRPFEKPDRGARRVSRDDYPALTAFFAGYLHEDLVPEHGSAAAAAIQFRGDANPVERRAMEEELRRLLARSAGWTLPELRRAVTTLGAAWIPASRADLEALLVPPAD